MTPARRMTDVERIACLTRIAAEALSLWNNVNRADKGRCIAIASAALDLVRDLQEEPPQSKRVRRGS